MWGIYFDVIVWILFEKKFYVGVVGLLFFIVEFVMFIICKCVFVMVMCWVDVE